MRRALPPAMMAAVDVIVGRGSLEIRANDLALLMHQRGFDARHTRDALRALERRGWLLRDDAIVVISAAAINGPVGRTPARKDRPRRKHNRLPPGLFI